MKTVLSILFTLCMALNAAGQNIDAVTEMPEAENILTIGHHGILPRPAYDLAKYLKQNLHYPKAALDSSIQGIVSVRFVVGATGKIRNPEIVSPRRLGYGLEEEAKRVINSMPDWQPGEQNGKRVDCYYWLPVKFELEGTNTKRKRLGTKG